MHSYVAGPAPFALCDEARLLIDVSRAIENTDTAFSSPTCGMHAQRLVVSGRGWGCGCGRGVWGGVWGGGGCRGVCKEKAPSEALRY
jgi:hypothetical protein